MKRLFGTAIGRVLLILVPLAFLAVFYFYPMLTIITLGLAPAGRLEVSRLAGLFSSDYYLRTLLFTIFQAGVSTLLTLLLALPAAYVVSHYEFPGRRFLLAFSTIPFVLPTVVVAAAFNALLGPNGWLNMLPMALLRLDKPPLELQFTLGIILLAHIFYNYTIVLRLVGNFWEGLSPRLEEAARVLGANPWRTFRRITLPLLAPAVIAAALLVFIFCFTSFGVILILGGPHFATLEVEIYRQAVNLFNLPMAAALSVVQILCTLLLMVSYTHLQSRLSRPLEYKKAEKVRRRPNSTGEKALVYSCNAFTLLLLGSPLLALAVRSVTLGGDLSLRYYLELFFNRSRSVFYVPPIQAVGTSLSYALATTVLALAMALMAAGILTRPKTRGWRWLDPIFMLPLSTSAVTLGFGFILALARPPLALRGSAALVPMAHTLVAFPFVLRSILPVLRGINPRLHEAGAVLGASPWRVWRLIELPLIGRALLVGAVFAFTVSMGEFGATVFVAGLQQPTMPVAIYRFLGQPGMLNYGQALAMSTLLMLVCGAGFLTIEHFRPAGIGEF